MIVVAGPVNRSRTRSFIKFPPANKTGLGDGYIGYRRKAPDVPFMCSGGIKFINPPIVSLVLFKGIDSKGSI